MKHDASPRAHVLLLRGQGITINAIAQMYQVDRDTGSTWITQWEQQGKPSVHDHPRSDRPPKLIPDEQTLSLTSMQEAPRSLQQVVDR